MSMVVNKIILFSAVVAVTLSHYIDEREEHLKEWELFKVKHNKIYESTEEEEMRKELYLEKLIQVLDHNSRYQKGEVTYDIAINRFSDMTHEELQSMKGYRRQTNPEDLRLEFEEPEGVDIPDSIDWRTKGAVTEVKAQGSCGSCWAFSATGSLEGQNFLKTKKLISLSEQNLIDCSTNDGNKGCGGGYISAAFKYVKKNDGIDTEKSYPYEAEDSQCRYNPVNKGTSAKGFVQIQEGDEKKLQIAVATTGPVSVAIDATGDFPFYKSGVYKNHNCSSTDLDHAVLVVGYGTSAEGDYWLVKNSWGKTEFGIDGYIKMARNNDNMCGIATNAMYPIV